MELSQRDRLAEAAQENDRLSRQLVETRDALALANAQLADFKAQLAATARLEEQVRDRTTELTRSNRDLEQFAYVASHDLQEPLRMVVSYLQLLERRYKGTLDSDADEFIEYAVDGAKRMQRLINDLLAYSRTGRSGGQVREVDVEAVVDGTIANLETTISEAGGRVTRDALPRVQADGSQLGQLFQNLIANALKFKRDEPPHVHVTATAGATETEFAISDNGIGIGKEYLDRIFVIFQRLHRRDEYPGTGIGLALCKKIVEWHSGRIWVESEPDAGSTFYFTLPVAKGERS